MSTLVDPRAGSPATPPGRARHLLMCPPTHFDVVYAINPWMDPSHPVDVDRALRQWADLRATYEAHGHTVRTVEPRPDLPDMVYTANAALIVDGTALVARFRHPQRRGEEPVHARWLAAHGFRVVRSTAIQEGEGDLAVAGDTILAASGFRTSPDAHAEVAATFGREVVSLHLVDPRFYHLDTALCVLDEERIAYYPAAFSPDSRAELRRRYPDAVVADERDALAFGLNATSDGHDVFLPTGAEGLAGRLDDAGFHPVPIDLSELLRGGGSVKCCTLELRGRAGTGGAR